MKASPLPNTPPSRPWKRFNQGRFNQPSSVKKTSRQSTRRLNRKGQRGLTPPPPASPVIIDEAIISRSGRTYGALFPEPIPEPAILTPRRSAPVKSWKLWFHGLLGILGLFAVTLGIVPGSYAAGENGAVNFSLPSDSTSTSNSFSVASGNDESLPDSISAPEMAPNNAQPPEMTVAENDPLTTDPAFEDAPSLADTEAIREVDPSLSSPAPEPDSPLSLPPIEPAPLPAETPAPSSANRPSDDILNFPSPPPST
ncbi:MAG: hypothetical protein K6T90_08010, partial [Leptolyngbyaceae cyanobacterium HOT.MB2.61]|nr:hypothetical protein [Leptolyngbyaceae cyanobacterium HOT.MB2.61]